MKPKFKTTQAFFTSVWFATIALVCSDHAAAVNIVGDTVQGNLTVTGNSTGVGWGLFKQGVDFGNAGEAMLNWVPGTSPAGTVISDIKWADGSFLWRDTVTTTASNKMNLDAANNLMLYKANGTVGITLAPETGKITLPAGSGTSTGSGIYFGTSTSATLAASATGTAIFPSQVTLQNGLSVSSGNMNIASTTLSTGSANGALTVAGGIGVGQDSYFNGVRIGRGAGNNNMNTALGAAALYTNTTGTYNLATGFNALYLNTTGNFNSATGFNALSANTEGAQNTATGALALYFNTKGNFNTATGYSALYTNTTGTYNSATGLMALYANTTGNNNSSSGFAALYANTTGNNNSSTGCFALCANTTGGSNVAVGSSAGQYQSNGSTPLTDPENSIYIGANSRGKDNADNNSIVIGYQAVGEGANTTVIGNSTTTTARIFGNLVAGAGTGSPVLTQASALTYGYVTLSALNNDAVSLSSGSANGYYTTAMSGAYTDSGAVYSTAMSCGSAYGYSTTAMSGAYTDSGAVYSTAMSCGSAYGYSTTAMSGAYTDSGADYSTAMSCGFAYGDYSTAMSGGQAFGQFSLASGWQASTHSYSSTSLGSFNNSWGTPDAWVETDPHFTVGNGTEIYDPEYSLTYSNAITTLKNGQTTLTNKAWSQRDVNTVPATADPSTADSDSNGNALVVEGHTVMKGKVIIEQAQGDISMGIYE